MATRTYGQYCGFSRAVETLGERWALLIVRDLLIGGKRFGELQRGLPGVPSNILTARLKELEEAGIIARRLLPRPGGAVVYEMTSAGRELETAVIALGRWGAQRLGDARPGEIVTEDSIAAALLTTFRSEHAAGVSASFELHVGDDIVVNAQVRKRKVTIGRGPLENPDLIVEAGPQLRLLLAREITPAEALKKRIVRLRGDKTLFNVFAELFVI